MKPLSVNKTGYACMTVSIYDVAKRAGVSISTVSRILNGSANVSDGKAAAVQEAMEFYHYAPNQFARGLVKQRSNMIGVYFPTGERSVFDSSYNLELMRGIERVFAYQNYNMALISEMEEYPHRSKAAPRYLEFIRQKRIDGLLLSGLSDQSMRDETFAQVMDEGYPVVYIGKRFHKKGLNVYAQFEQYNLRMIDALRQCGHRKVLYYILELHQNCLPDILKKTAKEMPEMEVHPLILREWQPKREELLYQVKKYVKEGMDTAILSPAMEITQILIGICTQLGLSVPEQVSILSVEHRQGEGELIFPGISAFYVPAGNMGSSAAKLLIEAIQGVEPAEPSQEYEAKYLPRSSIKSLS